MTKEKAIYLAESLRVKGQMAAAVAICQKEAGIPFEQISAVPREEMVELIQLWRIWTVSLSGLYKKQWNGRKAADYLLAAKGVFLKYYCNRHVQETARETRRDPQGHEYWMRAEMFRDFGKFLLHLAEISGNPEYIEHAVMVFDKAIEASEAGTSARAVATMEKEVANRQFGEKINWDVFTPAYQVAVQLSPQAGGWDRMAAVSWWYAWEALLAGKKEQLQLGLENLKDASRSLGVNWIIRYPLKEATSSSLGVSRRLTYALTTGARVSS